MIYLHVQEKKKNLSASLWKWRARSRFARLLFEIIWPHIYLFNGPSLKDALHLLLLNSGPEGCRPAICPACGSNRITAGFSEGKRGPRTGY